MAASKKKRPGRKGRPDEAGEALAAVARHVGRWLRADPAARAALRRAVVLLAEGLIDRLADLSAAVRAAEEALTAPGPAVPGRPGTAGSGAGDRPSTPGGPGDAGTEHRARHADPRPYTSRQRPQRPGGRYRRAVIRPRACRRPRRGRGGPSNRRLG